MPETHALFDAAPSPGVPCVSELELAYRWEQERPLAVRGRCSPSPGPTARRPRRCWPSRCCAPAACARWPPATPTSRSSPRVELDARRVRRRVHELPAGVDRAVPRRRRGVAQPRPRSPQLAPLDGVLRGGQGAGVRPASAPTDVAIGVRRRSRRDGATSPSAPARHGTFGLRDADYRVARRAVLSGPSGAFADGRADAPAPAPRHHQRAGRRSARARAGAGRAPTRSPPALASFTGPPHRIELVGEADGVALVQRLEGDDAARRVGGDPGFDQHRPDRRRAATRASTCRRWRAEPRRASAPWSPSARRATDIEAVSTDRPVVDATSMAEAVERAGELARPGDVVAALAGLRQLRLVPRRRLPGTRRRLPPPRQRTTEGSTSVTHHDPPAAWLGRPGSAIAVATPSSGCTVARQGAGAPAAAEAATRRRPPVRAVGVAPRAGAVGYYVIAVVVVVFVLLGLVMVLSASATVESAKGNSPYSIFNRQLTWAVIGLAGLLVGARLRLLDPAVGHPGPRGRPGRRWCCPSCPGSASRSTTPGRGSRSATSASSPRSSSSSPSSSSPPTCWSADVTRCPTCAAACARSPFCPCGRPVPAWHRETSDPPS